MAARTQFGLHQMPVPADVTSTVDQDECGHQSPFRARIAVKTLSDTEIGLAAATRIHNMTATGPATMTVGVRRAGMSVKRGGVEAALRTAGGRRADLPSTLARSLSTPSTNRSAAACVAVYLHAQLRAVVQNDPLVRTRDADGIHDMRVAVRRLRSTLRTFRPVFDRPRANYLGGELYWLAGLLGAVRDRDVLRDLVDALPAEQVDATIRSRIHAQLDVEQAGAHAALSAALDEERYAALWSDLDALATEEHHRATSKRLRHRAGRAVRHADDTLDRAVGLDGLDRDAALHDARKAYKQARYAAELVTPLIGGRAHVLAERLGRVQDVLGNHQDAVVAARLLSEFGVSAPPADIADDLDRARRRAAEIRI